MESFFYFLMLVIFVFVFSGITHRLAFSYQLIDSADLPPVVLKELATQFADFTPKTFRAQKHRNRFELDGVFQSSPGRLAFKLTPDSELSAVEYRKGTEQPRFVFRRKLTGSQVPPAIANRLSPMFGNDAAMFETSTASAGMIGDCNVFRINVDSQQFEYQFDVGEEGELFRFLRKEVA